MVEINTISILLFVGATLLFAAGAWSKSPVFIVFGIFAALAGLAYMFFSDGGIGGGGGGVSDCGGLPLEVCYCCLEPNGQVVYDCDPNCLSSALNSVRVDMQQCEERQKQGEINANCRQIVN